ncbi:GntR family transcriptional regulator [Streptomyces turgidiscabies]|uniref:FCD domain protein n=1 Tax=Streptomyces turgidiscabies (strain Car8) TaxID=698760 RepID=L7EWY2_STRT8|nr:MULTISPECIES: GntR family transcriptional regulator [Streptomyces]ELP63196.1 FCD domain protein [Streptomyces turgidiscabies Car8]MDX3499684.1 GntR family transcriptional regulator [Streptomyces turgidiscabies]GAQ73370.1 putative HTH-type transcriptional regulator [Streptomyces turgidiscabies]
MSREGTASETRIAEAIRAEILRGTLVPGQRLVEREMSERFAAGRSVVRLALGQLAAQGLVEIRRNRGACVRAVSLTEAADVMEARMTLEGLAAARAAERADRAQADGLRTLATDMQSAFDSGHLTHYGRLSARLHERIHDIAGHEAARRLIKELGSRTVHQPDVVSLMGDRAAISLRELLDVVEAVTASDPSEAEAAMRRHLTDVVQALRSLAKDRGAN